MSVTMHKIGESFPIQFVWRLPDGDFIRAVFQAEVLDFVPAADKYVVHLNRLLAGRQETASGEMRPKEELSQAYWALVGRIVGKKISVAYEAGDGRPLSLRLATLTGEHNYFTRFTEIEAKAKEGLFKPGRQGTSATNRQAKEDDSGN